MMTLDNAWMIAMVGMFGLFLIGIWLEARRSLRALAEDDLGANEVECEADYRTVMARLEARTKLSQMRNSAESHLSQHAMNGRMANHSINRNSYNLG